MIKRLTDKKIFIAGVLLVVIVLLLKAPPDLSFPLRVRTWVFNVFMFFLAVPVIWHVTRITLGLFASIFVSIFFSLLTIFPMWIMLGNFSQSITFASEPKIFSSFSSRWILFLFVPGSFYLARVIYKKVTGIPFPKVPNARTSANIVCISMLLLLAIPQFIFRFGTYSPTGIEAMDKDDPAIRPGSDGYFKLAYPTNDVQQHINPGGLFVGAEYDDSLSKGYSVHNDRPTIGYLYSSIGYFAHPYIAARLLLFIFYSAIILCTFNLARASGLSHGMSLAFGILLMSCEYIVTNANSLNVYIHVFGSQPIILYSLYRSKLFRDDVPWSHFALYCLTVCFLSIGYYPFVFCLFNIFCLLGFYFHARGVSNGNKHFKSKKTLQQAACVVLAPLLCKTVWMGLLKFYGMLGHPGNRDVASFYASHYIDVLLYAYHHPLDFLKLLNDCFVALFLNYITYEYWPWLGVFGLLGLLLVPRLVPPRVSIPLFAMFLSFFVFSLSGGIVASLYPHPVWSENMPLTAARANGGFVLFVLAQLAALSTIAAYLFRRVACNGRERISRRGVAKTLLVVSLAVYSGSFYPVISAWAVHHGTYPLYPGGLSAFGW